MRSRKTFRLVIVGAVALVAGACTLDIERNTDGSLTIVGDVTADSMAAEFERDPKNDSVEVRIDGGVMWLDVAGTDENGDYEASLRIELGAADGAPTVDITDASYNGWGVPDEIKEMYNRAIEDEIRKTVAENPDARLLTLTADDGRIVTEWRIETDESKSG